MATGVHPSVTCGLCGCRSSCCRCSDGAERGCPFGLWGPVWSAGLSLLLGDGALAGVGHCSAALAPGGGWSSLALCALPGAPYQSPGPSHAPNSLQEGAVHWPLFCWDTGPQKLHPHPWQMLCSEYRGPVPMGLSHIATQGCRDW